MSEVNTLSKALALENLVIHPFGQERAITFTDAEDVRVWLQSELKNWQDFYDKSSDSRFYPSDKVREHRNLLSNSLRYSLKLSEQGIKDQESLLKGLVDCLRMLEQPPYLSSASIGAQLIREANSLSFSTQLAIFALWLGEPLPGFLGKYVNDLDVTALLRASALWRTKDFGTSVEVSKIRKTISSGIKKWEANFRNLGLRIQTFTDHANNEASSSLSALADVRQKLEILFNTQSDSLQLLEKDRTVSLNDLEESYKLRFEELLAERGEALSKLELTFREHLRLKAPAEYWTLKSTRHRVVAKRWLVAVVGLSIFGILFFIAGYSYLLDWLDGLKNQSIGTATIVLLSLPGLLYASLVRITHRSYRDEVRQGDDAEQRATLVQTYLALVHEETGNIQPSERLLALHALFRGSAQSDSPDDTPPINALEALLQGLKPKSGG